MTAAEDRHTRELQRRLAEAEATIEALLSGQIDAVVDSTSKTPVLLAKAQDALREERDRAQRYLDTPDVLLLALDTDCRITLVNRYACAVLGWEASELMGRDWIDTCLPAGIRQELRSKFHLLLSGGLPLGENAVLTRSGEERLIEWRNTVLRDDGGRVIGTFSSGADISERGRAKAALQVADERMQFALEAAHVGIWDMDYTTGVLRWSDTMAAQYGFQAGTFPGTFAAFRDRIHLEDRAPFLKALENAIKTGSDFSVLNRATWPDGTVRRLSGTGRIFLGSNGEPVRGIGISQDVTERHTLEAQYLQAQKMDAVGRLAGGVAHDFNNLLTAILGYCELLLVDLQPTDPRQADIIQIQNAGTMAAGLTRQLLAFSRQQIIQPTLLDLNVIVADMRPMIERLIGADVAVVVNLRPNLGAVTADRGQVEQIIMNLAVNARDAMPKGGTLTINTANVDLDGDYTSTHFAANAGSYVALTVSDTGTGMTAEVQARLFEPFFSTKAVGRGTGLGLATVHGIVVANGGTVGVYSEVGKGTSLKVYFRRDAAAIPTEVQAPPYLPHAGVGTVLVVDDSTGLRELTRRFLQRQGYEVFVAASAEEALLTFEDNPGIDVLLTDVVMPGATGPELTRQLMKRHTTLKVIYMSGYTEDAISHHGIIDPDTAFLHKPFSSEALGRKMQELLGG